MSLAFKEGLKIPPPALNEIIVASNQDVRQVLPHYITSNFKTIESVIAVVKNFVRCTLYEKHSNCLSVVRSFIICRCGVLMTRPPLMIS